MTINLNYLKRIVTIKRKIMEIDEKLLDQLACPYCKVSVNLKNDKLVCPECGREFPVDDGIPNMLPDELR